MYSRVAQWWSKKLLTSRLLVRVQSREPFRTIVHLFYEIEWLQQIKLVSFFIEYRDSQVEVNGRNMSLKKYYLNKIEYIT